MYKKIKTIHLIGIGGIGMSGIAQVLNTHGYQVTGSDLKKSETVLLLQSLGIKVLLGHNAENIINVELVVYSSAVTKDNPEIAEAMRRGIPIISRGEMLAEITRLKHCIAVAGAHGKTTTTSMIGTLLKEAQLDPTIVVGGRMDNFGGTNARLGNGDFMVVEADESDGSFMNLSPSIGVVTNMDREHMDYYQTMARLKKAFLSFMNKVPFYGLTVFHGDDPYLRTMRKKISRRIRTYGFRGGNHYRITDYQASEKETTFKVHTENKSELVKLQVPGRHNALNAVAALAVADELEISRVQSLDGLYSFQGVQRRFQFRGIKKGIHFYDDYAHHPMEIAATLQAARERFTNRKIRAVFQPHRFSRVEDLFDQFSTCFHLCDGIAITDIYAAGEAPIPGVDGAALVETIRRTGHPQVQFVSKPIDAVELWMKESSEGDIIFTLGAGDLPNVYQDLF